MTRGQIKQKINHSPIFSFDVTKKFCAKRLILKMVRYCLFLKIYIQCFHFYHFLKHHSNKMLCITSRCVQNVTCEFRRIEPIDKITVRNFHIENRQFPTIRMHHLIQDSPDTPIYNPNVESNPNKNSMERRH